MIAYLKTWMSLAGDRRGITALEYAAIAGVLVAVVVTAATTLSGDISGVFNSVGSSL